MSEQITIAIIGGIAAIGGALIGAFKERQKLVIHQKNVTKGHVLSVAGMRSQVKIKQSLDDLRALNIDRVLLLRVTNGGKIPKPGSQMFASALDVTTWALDLEREILNKYTSVKVDSFYSNMCAQVAETPELPYKITVTDKPKSLLEGWYQAENVRESWVFNIHLNTFKDEETEKFEQYILSLAMYNTGQENQTQLTHINQAEIMRHINAIRHEFKKFYT